MQHLFLATLLWPTVFLLMGSSALAAPICTPCPPPSTMDPPPLFLEFQVGSSPFTPPNGGYIYPEAGWLELTGTVRFVNTSPIPHHLVEDVGAFDTGPLVPGGSCCMVFADPPPPDSVYIPYVFHCVMHPGSDETAQVAVYDPAAVVGAQDTHFGKQLTLEARPNPFASSTTIAYQLPAGGGMASLVILDVGGRLVRTLVDGTHSSGGDVVWDGTDNDGSPLASGVYWYQLRVNGETAQRRAVLIRK